jgi:hypothetical protein
VNSEGVTIGLAGTEQSEAPNEGGEDSNDHTTSPLAHTSNGSNDSG